MSFKVFFAFWVFIVLFTASSRAQSQWVNISGNLIESSLTHVATHPTDGRVIYCSSSLNVFKSLDAGSSWKSVLNLGASNNEILCLYVAGDGLHVYAGTRFGLRMSSDAGKVWRNMYKGSSKESREVYSILENPSNPEMLWLGTGGGLVALNTHSKSFAFIRAIGHSPIHSLSLDKKKTSLLAVGQGAAYRSDDMGRAWKKVFSATEVESENQTLNQFDVEEVMNGSIFLSGAFIGADHGVLFSTKEGLRYIPQGASSAELIDANNLPTETVTGIADADEGYFVSTTRGIFHKKNNQAIFEEVYAGLDSKDVRQIFYNKIGNFLLAATSKGLFRLSVEVPGITRSQKTELPVKIKLEEILKSFEAEPTIRQTQDAAISYAEVHPDKIKQWRKAASRKALLPTVSLNTGYDSNQNIDLDRGGTNDPDHFIQGPDESGKDWSVTTSWNLSEIIWNDDQTSIDTRSKLMTELRDDILNEVNHLYFERRRLQVENKMYPPIDLAVLMEKELRLQELTAGLDALTGGYFSANLPQAPYLKP